MYKKSIPFILLLGLGAAQAGDIVVRDISGRTVIFAQNPQRIVLGESRLLYTIAILDREDPLRRIVAWADDLPTTSPDAFNKYKSKFPSSTAKIHNLGKQANLSAEQLISEKPDIVILTETFHKNYQDSGLLERLDRAHIPYAFVDLREIRHTVPSIGLLGKVFGQQARAKEFIDFYNKNLNIVTRRVAKIEDRPLVFLDVAAGNPPDQCCRTYGPYTYGKFIEIAGGRNWGSTLSNKSTIEVNPEAITKLNPPFIIATGSAWPNTKAIPLGYAANSVEVNARMRDLAQRTGFSHLKAIKNRQFYAIYHQFHNSAYNVFAIQQIAKWLHPKEFSDIDPEANLKELHRRFLPIDYSGIFWTQFK